MNPGEAMATDIDNRSEQGGGNRTCPGALRSRNLPLSGKLGLLALVMFGFGWAMVPLYNAICEATGIRVLTKRDEVGGRVPANTQVDPSRPITVEFDSNSHGPWRFRPQTRSVVAHPGELVTVEYELENTADERVSGQAIPSYAPRIAAASFRKVECFCFQQQALGPHETRRFPVVFYIEPALPEEITTITLSYTFFDVGGSRRPVATVFPAPVHNRRG